MIEPLVNYNCSGRNNGPSSFKTYQKSIITDQKWAIYRSYNNWLFVFFFKELFLFLLIPFLYFMSPLLKKEKKISFFSFKTETLHRRFFRFVFLYYVKSCWFGVYSKHVCLHKRRKLLIPYLENMSFALAEQNNTKISFFYFLGICSKNFPRASPPMPWVLPLAHWDLTLPPDPQLYARALHALLSVQLNNLLIKKKLFQPLVNCLL